MKFPRFHKKAPLSHKRMLLSDPNSLIGYRIDGGNIKLMSVLGVGGHGVVYHALETSSNSDAVARSYAVKALSKVGLDNTQLRALENEFAMHERVSGHAHIVSFHGIIEEQDFFFVLLDYIPDGDLFDMIEARGVYAGNDELIKSVFVQLLDAVMHCHRLGVRHRDIKPENILCRDGGAHLLLADFGLSTDRAVVRNYGLGSEPYMAPQCFGGFWQKLGPYSTSHTDVWSLGVVLINLTCRRNPWHKATEESPSFRAFLNDPDCLMRILPISSEVNAILRDTFALNPLSRPSLPTLRASVLAVRRFTRNSAPAPRPIALTPAVVVRKITNLTAEDIARLESDARAEARAVALRAKAEADRASSMASTETEVDNEDIESSFSPSISPASTLVGPEATPRLRQTTSPATSPVIAREDSDLDSLSDADSEGPITPETVPAPDVDIDSVPEITLEAYPVDDSLVTKARVPVPQVRHNAVRKTVWL